MAYRSEDLILDCLRSLPPEVDQVVVWDNHEEHGSAEAVQALSDPRLRVERSPSNLGFATAVNRAAALVPGADLLLLNPDSHLEPGAVPALRSALAAAPDIAVVGCRLRSTAGGPAPDSWRFPSPGRAAMGAVAGLGRAYRPGRVVVDGAEDIGEAFVPFTAALLRRQAFDQLGGFDESFWMYGEDTDYCYRVRRAGLRVAVAPPAVATHVGGASSDGASRAVAQLRGGDLFRAKHFGPVRARMTATALRAGASGRLVVAAVRSRLGREQTGRFEEWRQVRAYYRSGRP